MRQNSKRFRLDVWGWTTIVILLLYALFLLYPLSLLLKMAFSDGVHFTLENFAKFFSRKYYSITLLNSFKVSIAATIASVVVGVVLGIFAWLGGNLINSEYLNIMYIPGSGEIAIFMSAFVGALMGFLWYNSYPAQVFMGDTGSLTIGGIIGVSAILMRKELLLPVLCGIFFVESLSVIMQRGYFKYTKKKYGEGRRIFKMTPLHHHYQKEGIPALISRPDHAIPEAKIVTRFWLIGVILAVTTLALLKIR